MKNLAEKTYDAILKAGWIKGEFASNPVDEDGDPAEEIKGVCLLGGVGMAWCDDPWFLECIPVPEGDDEQIVALTRTLAAIIRAQFPDRLEGECISPSEEDYLFIIPRFNDHKDTTLEDIELVCKKASMRLEEEI